MCSNKRVALVGRFGGMNQREATNVLRSYQASVVDLDSDSVDWVVIGAEESPIAEADLLSERIRAAAAEGSLEILHETELWHRLGLVDIEQSIRRYLHARDAGTPVGRIGPRDSPLASPRFDHASPNAAQTALL